jgi:methylmalonyl-CoA mutase cobalamin-binding domain/chain
MSQEVVLKELKEAFKGQDESKVGEFTQKAIDAKMDPLELLEKHLLTWLKEFTSKMTLSQEYKDVVEETKEGEAVSLSDLIMYGECLNAAVAVLKPIMTKSMQKGANTGRVVIGTVEGDVHDIGKTIIASLWAASGYEINDLGYDVPAKKMVSEAMIDKADIIGVSCSLGMARYNVKSVVDELKKQGFRDKVAVISGGQASFHSDVETYGVDANAADIPEALDKVEELTRIVKERKSKK